VSSRALTGRQARAVVLAAQGFADPWPSGRADARHRRRVFARVGLVQIDSVNVVVRAHYLPMFSRIGAYAPALLDRASMQEPRELFEYWGHEASLIPVDLHPALRWRMARAEHEAWGGLRSVDQERPGLLSAVLEALDEGGAATAAAIEERIEGGRTRRSGPWWDWSHVKRGIEFLVWSGQVAVARREGFQRVYDLPERVLPARVLAAPTPSEPDAFVILVERAARSLGVATARDLRDYFRLPAPAVAPAVGRLVEQGTLEPVSVQGWSEPAYLHTEARLPARATDRSALIAPFDPLVWDRRRASRVFGFDYRLEIYVPEARRVHGYYVLPYLVGDRFTARVDLKADRQAGVLKVRAAHAEQEADGGVTLDHDRLAQDLRAMAAWLGLDAVAVTRRGDAARALAAAVRRVA
jgi:uncharacterized protein YcaQ